MSKDTFYLSYKDREITGWKKWAVLFVILAVVFTPYICIFGCQQSEYFEEPLEVKMKKPDVLGTTNGQRIQEVTYDPVTREQLKMATDSIFKLNSKNAKLVKSVESYKKIAMDISLKNPVTAGFVERLFDGAQDDSLDASDPTSPADGGYSSLPGGESWLELPAVFDFKSDTLNFHGEIHAGGVTLSGLRIPNYMYQRDVVKKKGFLNLGRERSMQIYNSNSLVQVDSMAAYNVKQQLTWWQKTGKPGTAAVLGGAIVYGVFKAFAGKR